VVVFPAHIHVQEGAFDMDGQLGIPQQGFGGATGALMSPQLGQQGISPMGVDPITAAYLQQQAQLAQQGQLGPQGLFGNLIGRAGQPFGAAMSGATGQLGRSPYGIDPSAIVWVHAQAHQLAQQAQQLAQQVQQLAQQVQLAQQMHLAQQSAQFGQQGQQGLSGYLPGQIGQPFGGGFGGFGGFSGQLGRIPGMGY
jgi:hypothetical protein